MYSCKWVHLAWGIVCCTPRWIQTPAIVHIIATQQISSTSAIAAKATASKENEIKKTHTFIHSLSHPPTHRETHIELCNIEFICRIKWESYISSASASACFEVVHVLHTNYGKSRRLIVDKCVCVGVNRPHLSFSLVYFCRTQIFSAFLFLCDEFGEYVWQYRDQVCACVCWSCSQRLKTTKMTNALSK